MMSLFLQFKHNKKFIIFLKGHRDSMDLQRFKETSNKTKEILSVSKTY